MKDSVIPIKNLAEYIIYFSFVIENMKHETEFRNNIYPQTLAAPNLLINTDTNKEANDNPKYTNDPIKACSEKFSGISLIISNKLAGITPVS